MWKNPVFSYNFQVKMSENRVFNKNRTINIDFSFYFKFPGLKIVKNSSFQLNFYRPSNEKGDFKFSLYICSFTHRLDLHHGHLLVYAFILIHGKSAEIDKNGQNQVNFQQKSVWIVTFWVLKSKTWSIYRQFSLKIIKICQNCHFPGI